MKVVAVTGCLGFIGQYVTAKLLARGDVVYGIEDGRVEHVDADDSQGARRGLGLFLDGDDAPVKAVWDAWTDLKQVAQWWGPRGFTLTTHSKDLRPGGHWSYTMHGPDGTDYPNRTHYFEVEKYSRLVYDHGASEDRPPLFRVTVNFSAKYMFGLAPLGLVLPPLFPGQLGVLPGDVHMLR